MHVRMHMHMHMHMHVTFTSQGFDSEDLAIPLQFTDAIASSQLFGASDSAFFCVFVDARTLMGCADPLRRECRKYHHQCPLGGFGSKLPLLLYVDVGCTLTDDSSSFQAATSADVMVAVSRAEDPAGLYFLCQSYQS